MVAALLHDIGKGGLTEHSVAGEPLARAIAARMGFDADAVDLIGRLVRWHLLLAETATTRDPDDPATVDLVAERVGSGEALELLTVAHRGRRPRHLAQGVVVVAVGAGRSTWPAGCSAALDVRRSRCRRSSPTRSRSPPPCARGDVFVERRARWPTGRASP